MWWQAAAEVHDEGTLHANWKDNVRTSPALSRCGVMRMHDMDVTLERPTETGAQVTICLLDGTEVPVRLRLLSYDGCEFESARSFAEGERISIRLYRMGSIRARITSQQTKIVEAEFLNDCPV